MKKIIAIIPILFIYISSIAQGIVFKKGSFSETLAKAKAENKMVFVDCYTTWCGPCKKMLREVFPKKEVGDHMNAQFVSIKIDLEKGEGIALAKKYNVVAYPTLLFLDANGKVIHKKVGGANVTDFIEEAKIATDPTKQIEYLAKQYEEGNRDISLVFAYIKRLTGTLKKEKVTEISKSYISTMPYNQYHTLEGFTIITYSNIEYKSAPYNYMVKNKSAILENKSIQPEFFDFLVEDAIINYLRSIANTGTLDELKKAIKEAKTDLSLSSQKMINRDMYSEYYLAHQQWDNWLENRVKQGDNLLDKHKRRAYHIYIGTAYKIARDLKFETSKNMFDKAIELAEKVKKENDPEFVTVYKCLAELYSKTRAKQKALDNINKFIELKSAQGIKIRQSTYDLKEKILKI